MKTKIKHIKEIKDKFNWSLVGKVVSIIILAILIIGLLATYREIFVRVKPIDFHYLDIDEYWLRIFYIIAFILVVQFLFIKILGRVNKLGKLVNSIVVLNITTILITFTLYGIGKLIYTRYVVHLLNSFWDCLDAYISMTVLWPESIIWYRQSLLLSVVVYVILSTAIITPMLYNIHKKDTTSKKSLLISIMVSTIICYTCIAVFFYMRH